MSASVYAAETIRLGEQFELKSGNSAVLQDGEIITFQFNGIWKSQAGESEIIDAGSASQKFIEYSYSADFSVYMQGQEYKTTANMNSKNPLMFGPYSMHFLSMGDILSEELKDDSQSVSGSKGIYDYDTKLNGVRDIQTLQRAYLQGTGVFIIEKVDYTLENLTKKFSSINYTKGKIGVVFYPWISSEEATTVLNSAGLDVHGTDATVVCTGSIPLSGVINVRDIAIENKNTVTQVKYSEDQETSILEEGNCQGNGEDKSAYSWSTGPSYNHALVNVPEGQEIKFATALFGKGGVLNVEPLPVQNYEIQVAELNGRSGESQPEAPLDNANAVKVDLGFFAQIKAWFKNLFR